MGSDDDGDVWVDGEDVLTERGCLSKRGGEMLVRSGEMVEISWAIRSIEASRRACLSSAARPMGSR